MNMSNVGDVPRYYSQPWEIIADIFGGVNRVYSEDRDLENNALSTHSMSEILAGLMFWEFLMTTNPLSFSIRKNRSNIF